MGERVFCRYGRAKQEGDKSAYTRPAGEGENISDQISIKEFIAPFTGSKSLKA